MLPIKLGCSGEWCTQQESNLHRRFRKPLFYPLNYGCFALILCGSQRIFTFGPLLSLPVKCQLR